MFSTWLTFHSFYLRPLPCWVFTLTYSSCRHLSHAPLPENTTSWPFLPPPQAHSHNRTLTLKAPGSGAQFPMTAHWLRSLFLWVVFRCYLPPFRGCLCPLPCCQRQSGGCGQVEQGKGGINGDSRRVDLGWWTHNTTYRWCIIESYTWNWYNFINQCHPNKFNKT